MAIQFEYTKRILKELDPEYTPEQLASAVRQWWWSPQPNSLRLTKPGFAEFNKAVQSHEISMENHHRLTSSQTIGLQRYITCPFYCNRVWQSHHESSIISKLYFFEQRQAVEFILMGADIQKFLMFKQAKKA